MLDSCLVLAGGSSRRFGGDKLSAKIGRKSLLDFLLSGLRPHFRHVFVIGSDEHPDMLRGGPLGGIYTGLKISGKRSFVIGGDMPFFNPSIARYLSEREGEAVVPRHPNNFIEPLYAFYEPSICEKMKDFLSNGGNRIRDFLSLVRANYVSTEELRAYDPSLLCFFNVNRKEDLEKAKELLSRYIGCNPRPSGK